MFFLDSPISCLLDQTVRGHNVPPHSTLQLWNFSSFMFHFSFGISLLASEMNFPLIL